MEDTTRIPAGRLLLRPEEVARSLGVSRTTVFELMRSGALRSVKIGAPCFGNCAGGVRGCVGGCVSAGARRGKGEGAVFYEADRGRWVGVLDLGRSVDGRRVRRTVTGGSAREVRGKLRQLRDEVEGGARQLDGSVTVASFLTDWLEREVPKFARSVNTRENYRWAVEGHLVPGLGHIRLARLTADDVDALLESRAAAGLARSSVSRLRTVLGTALDHAARRDMCAGTWRG
jgi:excisionase family DNA binding protein